LGITHRTIRFANTPPELAEIVAAMTTSSGLPIVVLRSVSDDLFRMRATLAFVCAPRETVTLTSYVPGAEQRSLSGVMTTPGIEDRMLARWNSARSEGNVVHTQGYISEEGTLHAVAALALESLGGTLAAPISEEQRHEASMRLTPDVLRERHRRNARRWISELSKAPFLLLRASWRVIRDRLGRR
jgi:hypothetical protein